jgi:hypothetical protein
VAKHAMNSSTAFNRVIYIWKKTKSKSFKLRDTLEKCANSMFLLMQLWKELRMKIKIAVLCLDL